MPIIAQIQSLLFQVFYKKYIVYNYFTREGYIRTSSEGYDLNDENLYVHLTNNAVQKFSNKYGTHEFGN